MEDGLDTCVQKIETITLSQEQTSSLPNDKSKQTKKYGKKTLYWGIDVDVKQLLERYDIYRYITENFLILKDEFHVTLLFLQKGNNHKEEKYKELEGCKCKLDAIRYGATSNAVAVEVNNMLYTKDGVDYPVPSDQESINHITIALDNSTKPKFSVLVLHDKNNVTEFDQPFTLYGTIKRYTV